MPGTTPPDVLPALDAWIARLDSADSAAIPEYARRILREFPGTSEEQRAFLVGFRDEVVRLRAALEESHAECERLADLLTLASNRADACAAEVEQLRVDHRRMAEGSD